MKAIIFDLDGVILSTDQYHYKAWKEIADQENIEFNEEINNSLRGVSRSESLEIILKKAKRKYSKEEKEKLLKKKNDLYLSYLDKLDENYIDQDVLFTLNCLKEKGIKMAIGSSSKNTMLILDKVKLTSYFDVIIDGNQITHSKPHPEVFLLAREKLDIPSEDCLVIEDAISGIDAAYEGNFKTGGIGKAATYRKTTYPLSKLSDILKIIDALLPVIELRHIKKVYPNGVCAVKDFSLSILEGEFVVFVGPSGCGKSTVLRMIAGLEEISEGELFIDGKVMNDEESIKRNIAMVFQNYALYPHLTVRENIVFPLAIKRVPLKKFFDFKYRKARKEEIRKKGEEVAMKIGLSEYLDRKPANLSGGQRQRVALGRAIIRNPKAFLLDEPLSNLDAKMRTQMRTEISKLHNDLKTIFIYVTHDQIEAMTMGSKIVVMKEGVIQQIASPNELFLHPKNKFVASFIGSPQMNFFEVELENKEDHLEVILKDNTSLTLPKNIENSLNKAYLGKKVIMGIRPKEISPTTIKKNALKGVVRLSEQLGDEALIYFTMDNEKEEYISSLKTYDTYKTSEELYFKVNLEHANFFDIDTEESIQNEENK